MSQVELERLIADVKADKDLQDKVKSIHPTSEAIVEWARAQGYGVTPDELADKESDRVVGGKGLGGVL